MSDDENKITSEENKSLSSRTEQKLPLLQIGNSSSDTSKMNRGAAGSRKNDGLNETKSKNQNFPEGDDPNQDIKRSRSKTARNPLVILGNFFLMLVVVVILAVSIPIYIGKNMFLAAGPQQEDSVVLIGQGSGIREIAAILEKQGLIRSADIFVYGVGYQEKARLLKAGEYAIPAHASMKDIMDILVNGKSLEHTFTVPEGLTVDQVFDRLAANDILVGDLPDVRPPEGSLMADTVNFTRGATRQQIIKRLYDGQQKLVADIWSKRAADLPIKNIHDFVTLASIVEKETGVPSERPQVAAVFYNRLAKNMRLQSDPTVIYGLFGGKGKPSDRPIYRSDLDKETPYNTYKINGLPPTPIANPGRDALLAVANPPKSDALYFVADGTGGHVFSKTLDEHNSNVRKWRALENNE
ncbi:endolytic transglycosylase MltG [uncultured Bartonella sp.]|uniref:endolytic transglycosylase MltG n=1 Tax=uncultured Bartonella sp. TaxID=104108 RepID=UPI002623AFAD|nr:endolytic transglycosylase MltG [uncultured Bartonella sp.]